MQVRSLASFSELRIRHYHELWCRLQMQLGSQIAVAVVQAGSCSSDSLESGRPLVDHVRQKRQISVQGVFNSLNTAATPMYKRKPQLQRYKHTHTQKQKFIHNIIYSQNLRVFCLFVCLGVFRYPQHMETTWPVMASEPQLCQYHILNPLHQAKN